MKPRFILLVPFYNVADYITETYQSILSQDYDNWIAMFGDDCSTDGSLDLIPDDPRFIKIRNNARITALPNTHNLITSVPNPDPEDVLVILDGDDKLLDNRSLLYLAEFYDYHQPLLTYGQFISSEGKLGHCIPFKDEEQFNNLRQGKYFLSHLRTWKYKLYTEFLKQDPKLSHYKDKNGKFFETTADVAVIYPMAEIAGYQNVKFCSKQLYWYRIHPANDKIIKGVEQVDAEEQIKAKPKLQRGNF